MLALKISVEADEKDDDGNGDEGAAERFPHALEVIAFGTCAAADTGVEAEELGNGDADAGEGERCAEPGEECAFWAVLVTDL